MPRYPELELGFTGAKLAIDELGQQSGKQEQSLPIADGDDEFDAQAADLIQDMRLASPP